MENEYGIDRLFISTNSHVEFAIPTRLHYANFKDNNVYFALQSGKKIEGRLMFITEVGHNIYNLCLRDKEGIEHERLFPISESDIIKVTEALKKNI